MTPLPCQLRERTDIANQVRTTWGNPFPTMLQPNYPLQPVAHSSPWILLAGWHAAAFSLPSRIPAPGETGQGDQQCLAVLGRKLPLPSQETEDGAPARRPPPHPPRRLDHALPRRSQASRVATDPKGKTNTAAAGKQARLPTLQSSGPDFTEYSSACRYFWSTSSNSR